MKKSPGRNFSKSIPDWLNTAACIGVASTAYLASKATLKSCVVLNNEGLSIKEKTQRVWKNYILAVVSGGATIASVIFSRNAYQNRISALTSLVALSDELYFNYRNKVRETMSASKETKIHDEVINERIQNTYLALCDNYNKVEDGKTLCYDVMSNRYFRADIDVIKRKEIELQKKLEIEMTISLNDLYYEIGLEETRLGDNVGWDTESKPLRIRYSSHLTEGGEPCLAIDYEVIKIF